MTAACSASIRGGVRSRSRRSRARRAARDPGRAEARPGAARRRGARRAADHGGIDRVRARARDHGRVGRRAARGVGRVPRAHRRGRRGRRGGRAGRWLGGAAGARRGAAAAAEARWSASPASTGTRTAPRRSPWPRATPASRWSTPASGSSRPPIAEAAVQEDVDRRRALGALGLAPRADRRGGPRSSGRAARRSCRSSSAVSCRRTTTPRWRASACAASSRRRTTGSSRSSAPSSIYAPARPPLTEPVRRSGTRRTVRGQQGDDAGSPEEGRTAPGPARRTSCRRALSGGGLPHRFRPYPWGSLIFFAPSTATATSACASRPFGP